MQGTKRLTEKDYLIWDLLQDPHFRVTAEGIILTRKLAHGRGTGPWRRAGWVTPSRGGQKLYRRLTYHGVEIYQHRIVCAKKDGFLDPTLTVDHDDLNGLNNHPSNLRQILPGKNISLARQAYKRMGLSAAEAKRNWIKGLAGASKQQEAAT